MHANNPLPHGPGCGSLSREVSDGQRHLLGRSCRGRHVRPERAGPALMSRPAKFVARISRVRKTLANLTIASVLLDRKVRLPCPAERDVADFPIITLASANQ